MRADAETRAQTQGSWYSHVQTKGVTVQSWADTGGHSTGMGRQRGQSTAMG